MTASNMERVCGVNAQIVGRLFDATPRGWYNVSGHARCELVSEAGNTGVSEAAHCTCK